MITYLVTQFHAYTMRTFISLWGEKLASGIRVLSYEYLLHSRSLPSGPYIFSDIERLGPERAALFSQIWKFLSEKQGDSSCLLNHPLKTMRRYPLLKALYERGINTHTIFRLAEGQMPIRYPVFLRKENNHRGNLTPLLYSPESVADAMKKLSRWRNNLDQMVMVEFCDTSDSKGVFRKYSAFIVGERIIPQHIMFSRHWMVKSIQDLANEEPDILEERDYVLNNPHEKELKEIFELAGIKYGRADYAVLDGKLQIWEINTNPILIGIGPISGKRREVRIHFLEQITAAFEAICNNSKDSSEQFFPFGSQRQGVAGWKQETSRLCGFAVDRFHALWQGAARTFELLKQGKDTGLS